MSVAEIERFSTNLKADPGLLGNTTLSRLEDVVRIAGEKGYAFTLGEAVEFLRTKAQAAGKPLTDAELDSASGGGCITFNDIGFGLGATIGNGGVWHCILAGGAQK
jgi:predicted ribosomally synthesized peptide with nif11-like leader